MLKKGVVTLRICNISQQIFHNSAKSIQNPAKLQIKFHLLLDYMNIVLYNIIVIIVIFLYGVKGCN